MFILYFIVVLEVTAIPSVSLTVVKELNIAQSQISYINTGFNLGGLFAPFFGFSGDKFGKKKVMIFGVIFFIIGTFLSSNINTLLQYVSARAVTGLGFYTILSLVFAYIGDLVPFEKRGKVSGLLKAIFALSVFVAPIYSTLVIKHFTFLHIYKFLSLAGVIILLFLFTIPEVKSSESENLDLAVFKRILGNANSIKFMLVSLLITVPGIMFFSYFAFHLDSIGLNQNEISGMFILIATGSMIAGLTVYFLSDKIGKIKLVLVGFLIAILGMSFLTSSNIWIISIFVFIFLLGFDIIHGLYLTLCGEIFVNERATFISILSLVTALTQFVLSLVAPTINKFGGYNLNVLVAFISLVIGVIIFKGLYSKFKTQLN